MRSPVIAIILVLAIVFLALTGGPNSEMDRNFVLWWGAWRLGSPGGTSALVLFTQLGGAPLLLSVAGVATVWLFGTGERRRGAFLFGTIVAGRLGLELVKLVVNRPRPGFDAHPVEVFSKSFPSGHAANSMTTYLALAVFAAPAKWRRPSLVGAVVLSLAIGSSRPMLGVHWPSDVLAGWLYGLLVVGIAWGLSQRGRSAA